MLKRIFLLFAILISNFIFCDWAQDTLQQMNLEDKIAQLFIISVDNRNLIDQNKRTDELQDRIINVNDPKTLKKNAAELIIKKYNVGGVHFTDYGNIRSCYKAINKFQLISKIPLLITQDFEWGLNMRLTDAIKFPKNMTLGAIQNNDLIYQLGQEIGRQCRALGVHVNFSPVIDINSNPENPVIGFRSFGDNPESVAKKGIKMMQGLQSEGVFACAKHFPGHGDTSVDSHYDLPVINRSKTEIQNCELYPFKKLIEAGVKVIMPGHIYIPALDDTTNRPITLSKTVITDILQNQLGFCGLIITDALNMKGVSKFFKPGKIELEAFLSGNDMLLMPIDFEVAKNTLRDAIVQNSKLLRELDRRVLKILKAKQELKLHNSNFNFNKNFSYSEFYKKNASDLKKLLHQEAITIVTDLQKNIPFTNNNKTALVQFGDTEKNNFYKLLLNYYPKINYYKFDDKHQENFQNLSECDYIIISLFDIKKSAKSNYGISSQFLDFYNKLSKTNKKIILVIFGDVYSLNLFKDINNNSTIIMAYEDDEDAQKAVAKVIAGKIKAKGKLPVNICK